MPAVPVFRDRPITVHHFADDVLVRCPRCARCARVFSPDDPGTPWQRQRWRMSCLSCGYHDERTGLDGRKYYSGARGEVRDPLFDIPLWLQAECCGGKLLWAYNLEHLAFLESFVAAKIRERSDAVRSGDFGRRMTMVAKLPAWLKSAKHRDEILRAIARLRTTVGA
jgi:hypothetical protein